MNEQDNTVSTGLSAEALALALDARLAIEAWHSALAKRGLTPQSCLAAVRHTAGETAVAKVQVAAAQTLDAHGQAVQREAMHSVAPRPALSRHVIRHGGV